MWSAEALLQVADAVCALRFIRVNKSIDPGRCYDFLFFPLNPPMPPPLCFGDAREGTAGDLSSRACRGTTPLAKHSERSVEHTPRIKHRALNSNQPSKYEKCTALPHTLITINLDLRHFGTSQWNIYHCGLRSDISYLKVCGAHQEQLLTPAAPATILMMKAPQIILELSAAEGLS